jgi:hypothetical protein
MSSWNSEKDSWREIHFIFRDVESQIRPDQWAILYVPALVGLIVLPKIASLKNIYRNMSVVIIQNQLFWLMIWSLELDVMC